MTKLHVVRTLPELKRHILKTWEDGDSLRKRTWAARMELGYALLELRGRIEAGEAGDQAAIDWWGWYEDNFRRSRSDAEKIMRIAKEAQQTGDPAAAGEKHQARNATYQATHRAKSKAKLSIVSNAPSYSKMDEEPPKPKPKPIEIPTDQLAKVDQILKLFRELDWPARKKAIFDLTGLYREWHGV